MAITSSGVRRVVIGLDGSEHAATALKWAVRLAKGMGCEITAVHAIDIPPLYSAPYGVPVRYDQEWQAAMREEFEGTWCKPLKASGVRYHTVMEVGRAASIIAGVADRENADVVVVGRRGRGGLAEMMLGSVSHELALHCKRPLLVIPRHH